jgi:hypothetical protein
MRIGFTYNGKYRIGTIVLLFAAKNYMKVALEDDEDGVSVKSFKISKCGNLQLLDSVQLIF